MSNPVLNERTLEKWAAPEASERARVNDGPVSEWSPPPAPGESMTVKGSVSATAVLLVLLMISAAYGWYQTGSPEVDGQGVVQYGIPSLAMVGVFVGLGLAFLMAFKPHLARFVAPIYALAQGVFVGSVSRALKSFTMASSSRPPVQPWRSQPSCWGCTSPALSADRPFPQNRDFSHTWIDVVLSRHLGCLALRRERLISFKSESDVDWLQCARRRPCGDESGS